MREFGLCRHREQSSSRSGPATNVFAPLANRDARDYLIEACEHAARDRFATKIESALNHGQPSKPSTVIDGAKFGYR